MPEDPTQDFYTEPRPGLLKQAAGLVGTLAGWGVGLMAAHQILRRGKTGLLQSLAKSKKYSGLAAAAKGNVERYSRTGGSLSYFYNKLQGPGANIIGALRYTAEDAPIMQSYLKQQRTFNILERAKIVQGKSPLRIKGKDVLLDKTQRRSLIEGMGARYIRELATISPLFYAAEQVVGRPDQDAHDRDSTRHPAWYNLPGHAVNFAKWLPQFAGFDIAARGAFKGIPLAYHSVMERGLKDDSLRHLTLNLDRIRDWRSTQTKDNVFIQLRSSWDAFKEMIGTHRTSRNISPFFSREGGFPALNAWAKDNLQRFNKKRARHADFYEKTLQSVAKSTSRYIMGDDLATLLDPKTDFLTNAFSLLKHTKGLGPDLRKRLATEFFRGKQSSMPVLARYAGLKRLGLRHVEEAKLDKQYKEISSAWHRALRKAQIKVSKSKRPKMRGSRQIDKRKPEQREYEQLFKRADPSKPDYEVDDLLLSPNLFWDPKRKKIIDLTGTRGYDIIGRTLDAAQRKFSILDRFPMTDIFPVRAFVGYNMPNIVFAGRSVIPNKARTGNLIPAQDPKGKVVDFKSSPGIFFRDPGKRTYTLYAPDPIRGEYGVAATKLYGMSRFDSQKMARIQEYMEGLSVPKGRDFDESSRVRKWLYEQFNLGGGPQTQDHESLFSMGMAHWKGDSRAWVILSDNYGLRNISNPRQFIDHVDSGLKLQQLGQVYTQARREAFKILNRDDIWHRVMRPLVPRTSGKISIPGLKGRYSLKKLMQDKPDKDGTVPIMDVLESLYRKGHVLPDTQNLETVRDLIRYNIHHRVSGEPPTMAARRVYTEHRIQQQLLNQARFDAKGDPEVMQSMVRSAIDNVLDTGGLAKAGLITTKEKAVVDMAMQGVAWEHMLRSVGHQRAGARLEPAKLIGKLFGGAKPLTADETSDAEFILRFLRRMQTDTAKQPADSIVKFDRMWDNYREALGSWRTLEVSRTGDAGTNLMEQTLRDNPYFWFHNDAGTWGKAFFHYGMDVFGRVMDMVGLGWDRGKYNTIFGKDTGVLNLWGRRIALAGGAAAAYQAVDTFTDTNPMFEATAFDEGLTVALADQAVRARMVASYFYDMTGITSAMKYMEGLMPKSSKTLPGAALGFAMGGVPGMIAGGVLNAYVQPQLAEGPLSFLSLLPPAAPFVADLTKSHEELRDIYSGRDWVEIRRGRGWPLGCLTPETTVQTDYGEYKRADEIEVGNTLVTMGPKSKTKSKVTHVLPREVEEEPVYTIKTYHSYKRHRFTGNHPVLVYARQKNSTSRYGWKRVDELEPGDHLVYKIPFSDHRPKRIRLIHYIPTDNILIRGEGPESTLTYLQHTSGGGWIVSPSSSTAPGEIQTNEELGILCGWFMAEGNLSYNNRSGRPSTVEFTINKNEAPMIKRAQKYIRDVWNGPEGAIIQKSEGCLRFRVSFQFLAEFLRSVFIKDGDKHIPSELLSWGKPFIRGFLFGLFYGDGHIQSRKGVLSGIVLTSAREQFILQTWNMLLSIGIFSYMSDSHSRNNSDYDSWRIFIPNRECEKFIAQTGFYKEGQKTITHPSIMYPRVKGSYRLCNGKLHQMVESITCEKYTGTVYDFTVEGTHNFATAQYIVHNSQPIEGGRVTQMRPNWYHLLKSQVGASPVLYGSKIEQFLFKDLPLLDFSFGDIIDPRYLERKHAETRPYPVPDVPLNEIPILGPTIGGILGRAYLAVHPLGKLETEQYEEAIGELKSGFGHQTADGFGPQYAGVGTDLFAKGGEAIYGSNIGRRPAVQSPYSPHQILAEQVYKGLIEPPGLMGWTISAALWGGDEPYTDEPVLATASEIDSFSRRYWDLNLGDPLLLCFVEGTKILTSDGEIPIESIEPGMEVLSKDNKFHKVLQKHIRPMEDIDQLYTLKVGNIGRSITATGNHTILAWTRKHCPSNTSKLCIPGKLDRCRDKCNKPHNELNPEWVRMDELQPGDFVIKQLLPTSETTLDIDLGPHATCITEHYIYKSCHPEYIRGWEYILDENPKATRADLRTLGISNPRVKDIFKVKDQGQQIQRKPRFITIDREIAWFLGWYLAEGSGNNYSVTFSLHKSEQSVAEDLTEIAVRRFGCNPGCITGNGPNGITLSLNHKPLREWLKAEFGSSARTKSIPLKYKQLPLPIVFKLFTGLIQGDGFWNFDKAAMGFTSASPHLARDVFDIGLRLKLLGNLTIDYTENPRAGSEYPQGSIRSKTIRSYVQFNKTSIERFRHLLQDPDPVFTTSDLISNGRSFIYKDKYFVRIKSIKARSMRVHKLYDLHIEHEHNYIAEDIIVHNSEGIRRLIPRPRTSIEHVNPLRNKMPNWLPDEYLSGDPYCLSPETMVETATGLTRADEINEGTLIRTINGRLFPVSRVKARSVDEKLYRIKVAGNSHVISTTGEHPFLIRKSDGVRTWRKARDLEAGEYVTYPLLKTKPDPDIHIRTNPYIRHGGHHYHLQINAYTASLIGELVLGLSVNLELASTIFGDVSETYWIIRELKDIIANYGMPNALYSAPINIIAHYLKHFIERVDEWDRVIYFKFPNESIAYQAWSLMMDNYIVSELNGSSIMCPNWHIDIHKTRKVQNRILWGALTNLQMTMYSTRELDYAILWSKHDIREVYFEIENIEAIPYKGDVYGYQVDVDDTFCAAGCLVHNTRIPLGEALLPGAGYESIINTTVDFPTGASRLGYSAYEQALQMVGLKDPLTEDVEEILDTGTAIHKLVQSSLTRAGVITKAEAHVFDPYTRISSYIDGIMRQQTGQELPLEIKTINSRGFQQLTKPKHKHLIQVNAYMHMLDAPRGTVLYVNRDDPTQTKEYDVRYDPKLWSSTVEELETARSYASSWVEKGYGDRMSGYSYLDRMQVLMNADPFSREYREVSNVVSEQDRLGLLSPEDSARYQKVLRWQQNMTRRHDMYPYRFQGEQLLDPDHELRQYNSNELIKAAAEYGPFSRLAGSLWEKFTHLRSPIHTKLIGSYTPEEQYERSVLYGSSFYDWTKPVDTMIEPWSRGLKSVTDPVQGGMSFGLGGLMLAGAPGAVLGGVVGAAYGTAHGLYRTLTGTKYVPGKFEEMAEVQQYFDRLKYQQAQYLWMTTKDTQYLRQMQNTAIGWSADTVRRGDANRDSRMKENMRLAVTMHDNLITPLTRLLGNERLAFDRTFDEGTSWSQLSREANNPIDFDLGGDLGFGSPWRGTSPETDLNYDALNIGGGIAASPYWDRPFFTAFLETPVPDRAKVLRMVDEDFAMMLRSAWRHGTATDASSEVDDYFTTHYKPPIGHPINLPDVNIDDWKYQTVEQHGLTAHDFGVGWRSQLRSISDSPFNIRPIDINATNKSKSIQKTLSMNSIRSSLQSVINRLGFLDARINIGSSPSISDKIKLRVKVSRDSSAHIADLYLKKQSYDRS